ncbi:hypothetical protein FNF29_02295 [Cafeteria roenbergensis]|uniref:non-specific serine/threonine protein kinase n=1 Tax=Cafeteria roenbergensis TaxID=33653 RepID=A0A5A8CNS5_CAFRO|nr:hypothetical protein FNF29_02295 [Cafeteria roenbergensis]|eukprot:KAA0154766.1 hypothetical protein FNF29_02295 [Cafeteria roenbergensis]
MEKYVLLDPIGEGSFGKVYKARLRGTGQFVAIKKISTKSRTAAEMESLREELRILRRLNHPNIVRLLDSFETNRHLFVVTEFAQGDLFSIIEDDRKLPEAGVREVARQLVEALQYLHSRRIIHRDMKPQNCLLMSAARGASVKLCDFGFARSMSLRTLALTSIKGTPLYMAPEVVRERPYDHRADLWALGVIVFELAAGEPPFYASSIYTLVNRITADEVRYPSDMSAELRSFLEGLLQKDAAARLDWPQLADHPFVRATDAELEAEAEAARERVVLAPAPVPVPGSGPQEKTRRRAGAR